MSFMASLLLAGCLGFGGGGQDVITIQMPFAYGYSSLCTQGVNGSYSHGYSSTRYDLDLDTPNDRDDYIYAPIGGTAYVHDSDRDDGFGVHINIDLGDGTYIILAHLDDTLIGDGEEVAQGQLIAIEGTTGASSGDHLHIGRHSGDATSNGWDGVSLEGLVIEAYSSSDGGLDSYLTSEFVCDLSGGHYYQSRMETPVWHPNGTLVMTPNSPDVYVLNEGYKYLIEDEGVFWSYNWDFSQLVYVDETELACYADGASLSDETQITAVYNEGVVWLLVGAQDGEDYLRYRVSSSYWQAILKSWGITASTYDDLSTSTELFDYYYESSQSATLREGTLVTEASSSDVYVIMQGAAYPILDWDTYLGLGFWNREVIALDDGAVHGIQGSVGDCNTGFGCITYEDLLYCGGESWDGSTYPDDTQDTSEYGDEGDTGEPLDEPEDDPDDPELGDTGFDDDPDDQQDTGDEQDEQDDPDDDPVDDLPDDLGEGLSWIRVDGGYIGLRVAEVFDSSVDGEDVAATGVGVDSGWGYNGSNLADYESETDMAWYELSTGWYRMTMRTSSEWAIYNHYCASTSSTSDLCHENADGSYALCFEVSSGEVQTLSSADCATLE
ncbi:M23 family metallopeptidase [Candidatus Uhrbacteria bacterium]|nr:M23 family metallopeptidase [Candidatus Uhrbacteria bacterium]MBT7716910.1 M23 family metallopeptidase [Candidatus Uhrbacteria bacterium]